MMLGRRKTQGREVAVRGGAAVLASGARKTSWRMSFVRFLKAKPGGYSRQRESQGSEKALRGDIWGVCGTVRGPGSWN